MKNKINKTKTDSFTEVCSHLSGRRDSSLSNSDPGRYTQNACLPVGRLVFLASYSRPSNPCATLVNKEKEDDFQSHLLFLYLSGRRDSNPV